MRIGHGYDVHKLVEERRLIMGVDIPREKGALGASDADVLLHAIADAILGALAEGDIGAPRHRPGLQGGRQPESFWSMWATWRSSGGTAWATWTPPSLPSVPRWRLTSLPMRENIARVLKSTVDRVNVKATTEEGLSFTGRGRGSRPMPWC